MYRLGSFNTDMNTCINQTAVPMSEQVVIQHLKFCRDLTRGFTTRTFPHFWRYWCKALLELATQTKSEVDKVKLFEIHNLLVVIQQPAEKEFCQYLDNGFVKFKNKTLASFKLDERIASDMPLDDHVDFEETIAITSIAHRTESACAEQLWTLQQRLALLNNGEKLDGNSIPASPVEFCEALRQILSSLDVDAKMKMICYKIFCQEIVSRLDQLYVEINQYFVHQNLLPNLQFATLPSETLPAIVEKDVAVAEQSMNAVAVLKQKIHGYSWSNSFHFGDVQRQSALLNAVDELQARILHGDEIASGYAPADTLTSAAAFLSSANGQPVAKAVQQELCVYKDQQLISILDSVQTVLLGATRHAFEMATVNHVNLLPQQVREVNEHIMRQIFIKNTRGAIAAGDMHIINVVGMLFDFIARDKALPAPIQTLLGYLYIPILKVAFLDKDFFVQAEHPSRILLNSLAEAGIRWVDNKADQFDIFSNIKITVFRVLESFQRDVHFFTELLIEFSTYTYSIACRQELLERRTLEKTRGEEKLYEVKLQVNNAVFNRISNRELPSAILLLLLQPWSDYLAFVLLRHGSDSKPWQFAIKVMDDLLWSLEPKTLQMDKEVQLLRQNTLLAVLERGFETIGYEQIKSRKLIEAVMVLQKMALQCRKPEPASAMMRTRLETMAAEKAGNARVLQQLQTAEETAMIDTLKTIEAGNWFEFVDGRRLKLISINAKTNHFMLIDQQGKNIERMTYLQLAREVINGQAFILIDSDKVLIERALENIYQELNAKTVNSTANIL